MKGCQTGEHEKRALVMQQAMKQTEIRVLQRGAGQYGMRQDRLAGDRIYEQPGRPLKAEWSKVGNRIELQIGGRA